MISSIENGELNAPVNTSDFTEKLRLVGDEVKADKLKAEEELATKGSFLSNMDAAFRTNFTGYSSFMNMVERKHVLTKDYVDDTFTEEEKLAVLKQAGVRPEGYEEIMQANNRELFAEKINDVNKFYEASNRIASMGVGTALAYSALPAIADIPSWVVGGAIGKTVKGLEFINKTTGLTNTALKVAAGGVTVGTAVGASEKLIQMESGVNDEARLNEAIMFGTALGAGGAALFPTIMGIGSVAKQAATSQAVQKTLTPVNDFFRKHLTLSTVEQLKVSDTAPQALKDLAAIADDPLYATYDHNGDLVASEEVAMGYRTKHTEGQLYNLNKQIALEADKAGMSVTDYARKLELDYREHSRAFEDAKELEIMKWSKDEQAAKYLEFTGLPKLPDGIIEDFFQVLKSGVAKDIKHMYPTPSHLKFIDDMYANVRNLADDAKLSAVAGKESHGYHHIKYNLANMLRDGKPSAIAKIQEMLLDTPLAKDLLAKGEVTLDDFAKEAERLFSVAENQDINHKFLGKGSGGATSATKFRRLSMNTRLYPEFFSENIGLTMTEYLDNMVGKLAVKKFFNLDSDASGSLRNSIDKYLREQVKAGASKADIDNAEAIIETVLGTRRMQKDPHKIDNLVGRISRKTAGALYNAGFSKYTLAEIGSVIGKFGLINTIKNFIPAHKMMLESISKMEPNDPNIKYFTNMGIAGQVIKAIQYDRMDMGEIVPYVGKGEQVLDTMNHLGRKISFFNHLQDTVDFMAGSAYLTHMMEIVESGRSLSRAEAERFSRYGIGIKDLKKIKDENIIYWEGKDIVKDYNFYNWNDKELGNKVLNSLQAAVRDTIVRTDGTRIHRYQSEVDGIFKPLFFQFTQFPVAAFERMLLNTNEVTARTAVGVGASATIMYAMMELEDAALVAAGVKDRRASTDDLVLKALLRTPQAGLAQSVWDIPATVLGLTTSSGYQGQAKFPIGAGAQAVGGVLTNTVEGTKAFLEGDFEKGVKMYGKSTPIANSYSGLNIFFKAMTGQTIKERGDGTNVLDRLNEQSAFERIMKEHEDHEKYIKGLQ